METQGGNAESRENRGALRQRILAARDRLAAGERAVAGAAIAGHLARCPALAAAEVVFTYVAFRSEVPTLAPIRAWLAQGRTVAVPRTVPSSHMELYRLTDPDGELIPGYCGIPEPDPHRCRPVAPETVAAVILPGAVFDRHGGRLGYGGGYYDRFLASLSHRPVRIGLCFAMQIVPRVPTEDHDQPLDYLVSETGIITCTAAPVP